MEKAESDLKRYQDLYRRKLASDSDYILYKTNYETAQAGYLSSVANVQQAEGNHNQTRDSLSKTVIRSPMDGSISLLNSEVGESVVAQSSFTGGTEILRVGGPLEHGSAGQRERERLFPTSRWATRSGHQHRRLSEPEIPRDGEGDRRLGRERGRHGQRHVRRPGRAAPAATRSPISSSRSGWPTATSSSGPG